MHSLSTYIFPKSRRRQTETRRLEESLGTKYSEIRCYRWVVDSHNKTLSKDDCWRCNILHDNQTVSFGKIVERRNKFRTCLFFGRQRRIFKVCSFQSERPRFSDTSDVRERLFDNHLLFMQFRVADDKHKVEVSISHFNAVEIVWILGPEHFHCHWCIFGQIGRKTVNTLFFVSKRYL